MGRACVSLPVCFGASHWIRLHDLKEKQTQTNKPCSSLPPEPFSSRVLRSWRNWLAKWPLVSSSLAARQPPAWQPGSLQLAARQPPAWVGGIGRNAFKQKQPQMCPSGLVSFQDLQIRIENSPGAESKTPPVHDVRKGSGGGRVLTIFAVVVPGRGGENQNLLSLRPGVAL